MMEILLNTVKTFFAELMQLRPFPLVLVGMMLIVLMIIIKWKSIKTWFNEWRLRTAIARLGKQVLHNVKLPDGMDGLILIEHLVLTPMAIILISVKRYKGVIFAGDNIDMWTQVIDNGSFKFANPLARLDEDLMSIRALVPGIDLRGFIVFTNESEFPRGRPERVLQLSELKKMACHKEQQVQGAYQEAWDKILGIVNSGH